MVEIADALGNAELGTRPNHLSASELVGVAKLMPSQRKLSKTERVFELPPPLQDHAAPGMKPLRLRAVKTGEKLGDADFGALA
jgi:hypothetical protein